jgi:hypothetical protein
MTTSIAPIPVSSLTEATLDGNGVFDVLMRANKAHLESEFAKNRIKGSEYATVYLGSLESVMTTGLQFLLQQQKAALEAQLIQQQILLAQVEVQKAQIELQILQANLTKIPAEIALLQAQAALVGQQKLNAEVEYTVLVAQECKLRAEFDVLMESKLKTAQEVNLLAQKVATERAQIMSLGVDEDSVIGKQKLLYQAQTNGFTRDAEQKAAKLLVDTWNVRRTTDEGTIAGQPVDANGNPVGTDNGLGDGNVARAINKLLAGVGA